MASGALATAAVSLCVVLSVAQTSLRQRIIAAEDARVPTDAAIAPILEGLRSGDVAMAATAARALGRFERPALVAHLLPLLAHPREEVRRETANALGQSVAAVPRDPAAAASDELNLVARALLERIGSETDPYVRGTVAATLGRLPYRQAEAIADVEVAMQRYLPDVRNLSGPQPLHPGSLTGVVTGFEALIRMNRPRWQPGTVTVDRLKALATSNLYRLDEAFRAIRRLAWLAVTAAAAADVLLVEQGYADPDYQVRRLAIAAAASDPDDVARRRAVLMQAFADPSFQVRHEVVRAYGRLPAAIDCAPLIVATRDANTHVSLAAIDALGERCAGVEAAGVLAAFADRLPDAPAESGPVPASQWHQPAHAIVSLARLDPQQIRGRLSRFALHPTWQVRAYAARAASAAGDLALLERLFDDDDSDNVRYEALQALRRLRGHADDARFIEALDSRDDQLILVAAEALEGSPAANAAVPALLRAFARLTSTRRETSRDPRVAILTRLGELGSRERAPDLEGCLRDFDPAVASACAATLRRWTGMEHEARPAPLDPEPPSDTLPARARVTMAGGGFFDLDLLTEDAPASVSRFVRLVRREYYDGLTFHRVIPNFIVQGGSPGANEYAGDGPFMRDEVGLQSNVRGAVGVSTRGRDTGDAQFFVNLLDNPRLDHEYTVFALVTSGMDVVDAIVEGDVIERIEIR